MIELIMFYSFATTCDKYQKPSRLIPSLVFVVVSLSHSSGLALSFKFEYLLFLQISHYYFVLHVIEIISFWTILLFTELIRNNKEWQQHVLVARFLKKQNSLVHKNAQTQ
jgi:hypothetical protein